ncbi:MAG: hypothetical protein KKF85_15450 [Gammaproteobacteria bacterium]|nr:hypothetical protein [Rhodocyclaceae bacterium]MBU3907938.1 hypothetical protein [Gammaproteobacteria bacterium]MBU4003844.1 hypothetical protein [Gammaproteobacteria bacterium]MBU4094836.1 hypothetical protein [Gammaproteobacteria bacterium]MBU4148352.1 hypothetical protein [Gammaproteobacteria bacterium]
MIPEGEPPETFAGWGGTQTKVAFEGCEMNDTDWPEMVRLAREGKHEPLIVALQKLQTLKRLRTDMQAKLSADELHHDVLEYLRDQAGKPKGRGRPAHSDWYRACMAFAVKQMHPLMQAGMESGTRNGIPLSLIGIPGDKDVAPSPMDAAIVAVSDANFKSPSQIRKIVYSKKLNKR